MIAFALMSALSVCWVLATPISASPDEPAHYDRAASIVRGQWLGYVPRAYASGPRVVVTIPSTYAQAVRASKCFAFKPGVDAACAAPAIHPSARAVSATTYVGRYPPLYYLVAGWPSLLTTGIAGFYLMATASALASAALLALAFATAWRWSSSPVLPTAVAVAATPMTLYLAATVNPSGLEITAAIATWTAAVTLCKNHPEDPPPALVAVLAVSAMILVSVRALSPVWPAAVVAALLPAAAGRLRIRRLMARSDVRLWALAFTVVFLADVAWVVLAGASRVVPLGIPANKSIPAITRLATSALGNWFQQAIGLFGWADAPAPWITYDIWYAAAGAILYLGVLLARKREVACMAIAVAITLIFPVALTAATAGRDGVIEQGRYFLPLAAGVPLLAGGLISRTRTGRDLTRRLRLALGGSLAFGQLAAFWWALHRYLVGVPGPAFSTAGVPRPWHPPLPWAALDIAFAVLCALYAALLWRPPVPSARSTPAGG